MPEALAFNADAEESVLGSMLLSKKAIETCSAVLDPEDFYLESNGILYANCLSMHMRGEEVDVVTLLHELELRDQLKNVGGKSRLHELAAIVSATSNVGHYAKIVKAKAEQRRMMRVLSEALKHAEDGRVQEAEEMLSEVGRSSDDGLQVVSMFDAMVALEEEIKSPPEQIGVDAPFSFWKSFVGGRVYVLGGYQGEGKTSIAGQCVQHAAQNRVRTGMFTLEMTWRDLRDRFVASFGVPYEQLQERRFTSDYALKAYEEAMKQVSLWDVDLIDKSTLTVADIRRVQKLRKYEFIVIDHLHQFDWKERRDIERIVAQLVAVAKEFNVPILLLAQLRRPFGTDRSPRPTMAMLRESGMIEAVAAQVAFVYRPRNDSGLRAMEAELNIVKNRYGPEGNHKLIFVGEQVRFIEPL